MKRVAAVVVGLVFAVAALWVKTRTPDDYDRRYAPLSAGGHLGTPVTSGGFTVKAEKVEAARSVVTSDGEVVRPDGVFVIITASARSRRAPLHLSTALLHTRDGREFRESTKNTTVPSAGTLDALTLAPGLWRRGVYVFEIPPTRLAGAALYVSDRPQNEKDTPGGFPPFGFELTAQANIDLGLDTVRARALVAGAPERVTVRGAST